MKELNEQDRERIEQEAIIYTDGHGSTHKNWRGFLKGAEYATLYERQQQADSKYWAEEQAKGLNAAADRNFELQSELTKANHTILSMTAERTELRNKVIDECISQAFRSTDLERRQADQIENGLNSLKTK